MTTEPPQRRQREPARPRRDRLAPLYDAAFEHDACGIGFVADAGGRRLADVLPLALGGLAALAHRGAFGADGASSDGAGVSLPLDPTVIEALAPGSGLAAEGPAVVQLFLPRTGPGARGSGDGSARGLVLAVLAAAGLEIVRWRTVPTDPSALGGAASASRPAFVQAFVRRPVGPAGRSLTDAAFERRRVVAPQRPQRVGSEVVAQMLAIAPLAHGKTSDGPSIPIRSANVTRIFSSPRRILPFTVPSGIPSISAISVCVKPPK
jgi:glutamate synthase (NADPH/NADH) large chain